MNDDIATSDRTALVVIPADKLPTIIAADTDDILGKLSRKVATFKPDVSTAKGRNEMRSLAAEIASAKMDLIRIGKGLTETWRKSTKAVNEECNIIEERMNALRDRVRERLTEYENREKVRVAAHEAALAEHAALASFEMTDPPSDLVRERLAAARTPDTRQWEEFRDRASDQRVGIIDNLSSMLAAAVKREADAAELARLRAEAEERERQEAARRQAEHEAKIAAEAAEAAKRDAERIAAEEAAAAERRAAEERERIEAKARAEAEAAEAERLRIIREAKEREERAAADLKAAQDKAEADRVAAEQREREAKERAEAAERKAVADAKLAEERAEAERQAALHRERQAAEKAERDKAAAVEQEKARAHAEKKAEEAAQKAREANKAHKAKINREALAALILCGLTEQQGVAVVTAIAKGEVPHCKMEY